MNTLKALFPFSGFTNITKFRYVDGKTYPLHKKYCRVCKGDKSFKHWIHNQHNYNIL